MSRQTRRCCMESQTFLPKGFVDIIVSECSLVYMVCIHTHSYIYIYIYTYIYINIYIWVCGDTIIYRGLNMNVCICEYIYIYIYILFGYVYIPSICYQLSEGRWSSVSAKNTRIGGAAGFNRRKTEPVWAATQFKILSLRGFFSSPSPLAYSNCTTYDGLNQRSMSMCFAVQSGTYRRMKTCIIFVFLSQS